MKTKINSVKISIQPAQNFRTTKGGKRILTSDPAITINLTLGINLIPDFYLADVVEVSGQNFIYYPQQDGKSAHLRNWSNQFRGNLSFNTDDEIDIEPLVRMYAEGGR